VHSVLQKLIKTLNALSTIDARSNAENNYVTIKEKSNIYLQSILRF